MAERELAIWMARKYDRRYLHPDFDPTDLTDAERAEIGQVQASIERFAETAQAALFDRYQQLCNATMALGDALRGKGVQRKSC